MKVFVKRYPSKKEFPKTAGYYDTNAGRVFYVNEKFDRPKKYYPIWWLEEIELPSEEEVEQEEYYNFIQSDHETKEMKKEELLKETSLEEKAKFFALYWGQRVLRFDTWTKNAESKEVGSFISDLYNDKCFIELKPLSSISDEDAEYCIGKTECSMRKNDPNSCDYGMSPSSIFVNSMIGDSSYHIGRREADYLRSKGYAIKWIDKTVKDQVSDGWVKLKGETK